MSSVETAPEQALEWVKADKGAALATVIETWGSAPRRAGAQMVVSGAGDMMGSVSGGCVEGAVVVEAMEALEDGNPRLLEYGVSDGDAFAVGLACGGTIKILVEPVGTAMPTDTLSALVEARASRQQVAYVVDTENWNRRLDHDGHATRFAKDRTGMEDDGKTFGRHPQPAFAIDHCRGGCTSRRRLCLWRNSRATILTSLTRAKLLGPQIASRENG